MRIDRFEDLEAWKEARLLVNDTYGLLACCKDYGFRDQMQRAAISIMSNIAEGFDRGSNREFIQFLIIARGSISEVKSLAYAGLDVGHFKNESFDKIIRRCVKLQNVLNWFIRYLRTCPRKE